ncbi:hypothetical protein J4416_04870 [Candidatus Pacearchaeota archaeon]|nr:hypothetical protein [Candidatus Pacearchaeota archaeon]
MKRNPLVIGVGGLLEKDENGRVTDILANLRNSGCSTYEVKFSRICRNGYTVVCPVSLAWIADITTLVDTALQDPKVDTSRVGLVGSSLGAAMIDQYLASNNQLTGREISYAAISPFARINPSLKPWLESSRNSQKDLEMSTDADKKRGMKRIIPYSNISTILEINTPEILRGISERYEIKPLTIYGLKDERVDPQSIEERHYVLKGKGRNLIQFDCGHNTPYKESIDLATEFLKSRLLS